MISCVVLNTEIERLCNIINRDYLFLLELKEKVCMINIQGFEDNDNHWIFDCDTVMKISDMKTEIMDILYTIHDGK